MRRILYLFIFAVMVLIVKAFFLDEYIARFKHSDSNTTAVEANVTETNQSTMPEGNLTDANRSGKIKARMQWEQEEKKMPLEQLGDELTKHIKL